MVLGTLIICRALYVQHVTEHDTDHKLENFFLREENARNHTSTTCPVLRRVKGFLHLLSWNGENH